MYELVFHESAKLYIQISYLNLWSHSPVKISQIDTVLSVDAETIRRPVRDQDSEQTG